MPSTISTNFSLERPTLTLRWTGLLPSITKAIVSPQSVQRPKPGAFRRASAALTDTLQ